MKEIKKTIKKQIREIRSQSKKAAKILGVNDIEFLDFPDSEMDTVSNLKITKAIESIINKVLYTPVLEIIRLKGYKAPCRMLYLYILVKEILWILATFDNFFNLV